MKIMQFFFGGTRPKIAMAICLGFFFSDSVIASDACANNEFLDNSFTSQTTCESEVNTSLDEEANIFAQVYFKNDFDTGETFIYAYPSDEHPRPMQYGEDNERMQDSVVRLMRYMYKDLMDFGLKNDSIQEINTQNINYLDLDLQARVVEATNDVEYTGCLRIIFSKDYDIDLFDDNFKKIPNNFKKHGIPLIIELRQNN